MKSFPTILFSLLALVYAAVLPNESAAQPTRSTDQSAGAAAQAVNAQPTTIKLVHAKAANQLPSNAFGIRFTGGIGFKGDIGFNEYPSFGAELSYQRLFSPKTRLEADFGMRFYDYNPETKRLYPAWLIATSYHWRWPVGRTAGFYAGPAIQFGRPYFWFGLGVQTGFDWQFAGPFQLSIDLRPTYSLWSGLDTCLGIGLRYAF